MTPLRKRKSAINHRQALFISGCFTFRIEPDLQADIESILVEDESLSTFVLSAARKAVEYRRGQLEFSSRPTT